MSWILALTPSKATPRHWHFAILAWNHHMLINHNESIDESVRETTGTKMIYEVERRDRYQPMEFLRCSKDFRFPVTVPEELSVPRPVMPLSVRCCLKKYMADLRRSTCGKSLCVSQVIYSRNGGCGVWSVLWRMLKIDWIRCQAAWCLSQKLPGTVDSSTESWRRFCRSMLRFRVPRRTANAPWFPNDPYWLNHTYTFGVRVFLTDWTWMEIKCTYTKSCSLRFSIISMYLRIVLVRRARLLRRIDASNTYL